MCLSAGACGETGSRGGVVMERCRCNAVCYCDGYSATGLAAIEERRQQYYRVPSGAVDSVSRTVITKAMNKGWSDETIERTSLS